MPATKVIKQRPIETSRKTVEIIKPVKVKAVNGTPNDIRVPAVRKSRASSCSRCPQRGRCEEGGSVTRLKSLKPGCDRRARSISASARTASSVRTANVKTKCQGSSACPSQKDQRLVRAETKHAIQSHKAFTVIPPNPKKRKEIQKKAEAELAALEELRLSRAMAYVSINPSSVGGCMSLEEVRSKQQQEMMKAKRKPKLKKILVMEEMAVVEV